MLGKSVQTSADAGLLDLFDFCKGVAIAGVVLVHVIHSGFGWQGVHVFIVLSGFGLAYSRARRGETGDWAKWFRRRMLKILPSYYAAAVLGFAVVALYYSLGLYDKPISQTAEELAKTLFLIRNFSYKGMFAYPNSSLWYVPLVFGFYLVFPLIYRSRITHGFVLILMAALALEFFYRAFALYFLDGVPVAFGSGFLPGLKPPSFGQKLISDDAPFQMWAPFGFFPSRIGEFVAGATAGIFYAEKKETFERWIFSVKTAFAGLGCWLFGNLLLYVGLWGWIFADFFIAVGLTLVVVHLARLVFRFSNPAFAAISRFGSLSYYVFLTHLIFFFMFAFSYPLWKDSVILALISIVSTLAAIALTSLLLRRLDRRISAQRMS